MPRAADPLARSKLLRAARQEFAIAGLVDARVEDIARRAQVAKGSFYLHFKSKEQAFYEIVDHFLVELHAITEDTHPKCHWEPGKASMEAELELQDEQILEFLWRNRDILRMVYYGGKMRQHYAHVLDAFLDSQAKHIGSVLRDYQNQGFYAKDFDPDMCAWLVVGGWFNLSRRMTMMSAKPDLKAWAATLSRLFGRGLRAH